MKIGLGQINTTVGDFSGNQEKIVRAYSELCAQGAKLVIFPELVITGYPPCDLLFNRRFVADNLTVLQALAKVLDRVPAVVGFIDRVGEGERAFYNAAAWCYAGEVMAVAHKCLLPNYDVFDDQRYFQSGKEPLCMEYLGKRVGITICEDIWTAGPVSPYHSYKGDPVATLAKRGIDVLLNLSASPWQRGKLAERERQLREAARRCACPVVYCNAVGGNDQLIFDGRSLILNAKGERLVGLPGFTESLQVVDTGRSNVAIAPNFEPGELADIEAALTLGIRDYAHKSGFKQAVIGLSGGIDSAVTAAIAVRALGPDKVIGLSLPSSVSSQHSRDDAAALAQNLSMAYTTLSIAEIVQTIETTLGPLFAGSPRDVTEENIQARVRGLLLMAVANKRHALLLTTGNKSELAVGYCTLYGDMCGGLAVISDVPKGLVYLLARWINRQREIIPQSTMVKPPSAELRPDQKDENSLPPYPVLDEILERYIEQWQSSQEIVAAGFDAEVVQDIIRKVNANEHKRNQAPPGLKITPLAFGVGRRIPIVQKYG